MTTETLCFPCESEQAPTEDPGTDKGSAASLRPGHKPEPGTMLRALWLLKDADGLDRVRIYDLDPEQLRYEESARLVDGAWQLLKDMP